MLSDGASSVSGMTTAERAQMLQKIADEATVMVRQGGGSVRLALGNAEIGRLDVAISLNDDRVDLRVMAATDHVRDMINKELPALKDALSVQSLNLGSVEVGVGGGQHKFAEQSGNFFGQQSRNFQDQWQGASQQGFAFGGGMNQERRFAGNAGQKISDISRMARRSTLATPVSSARPYGSALNANVSSQIQVLI